jgi:signal transduction histidine kinase
MTLPPISKDELARLADLFSYNILDTPPEEELDEIVQLASEICNTPISTITLIDEKRQWHKARKGIDSESGDRDFAFCAHAINGDGLMMVPDTQKDKRFSDNPFVTGEPKIRFYAGVPLKSSNGNNLGTLCVIGNQPSELSAAQERALKTLARQVVNNFELRKNNRLLKETIALAEKQKEQLDKHNKMLTRLLSIISHDLKSPIQNLNQLFSMLLSEGISREDFDTVAPELQKSLGNTSELLNNLLGWASSQLRGNSVTFTEVHPFKLTEEVFHGLETNAAAKGNQLKNLIPESASIGADANMLSFVIRNLVSNANKFTASGVITVGLDEKLSTYEIVVTDTGAGMADDAIKQLFDWKNRQTTLGTAGEKGSGLGLLIVKQFAEQHNGRLSVQSEVGVGTKMVFEIAKDL